MSPKQFHSTSPSLTSTVHNMCVLPSKEQSTFRAVVRYYETKQLKKAIKAADTILKKFPNHGETLAMKGLILNSLDRKAEAIDLVRRGLRMNMKSHICWHVYGLLYRSERDYREAAKAYLNALRIDKDNQQILRDLALLQVQIRDYEGLEETRRRLLTVRPSQRNNWIGFALSYHLAGNYSSAISVLNAYRNTLSQSSEAEERYETSEILMYQNLLLEESGRFLDALAHLEVIAPRVVDRLALLEARVRLHAALQEHHNASMFARNLIDLNPDNHAYHHAFHACMLLGNTLDPDTISRFPLFSGLEPFSGTSSVLNGSLAGLRCTPRSERDIFRILAACDEISAAHPHSQTASRIALEIVPSANHPEFSWRADAYVRPFLRRGIPSLFSDLKPLYTDISKANALGTLFESYLTFLDVSCARVLPVRTQSCLSLSRNEIASLPIPLDPIVEPPCTLLWVLHFLAQHYDCTGHHELALNIVQRAIEHTPTAIECYLVKARILKHCGDLKGAVKVVDEARSLDLADRYLNTKCCKYALRAEMIPEAELWISQFTRDNDSSGLQALYDMQCVWFELGEAESHLRRKQLPQALKKFTAVQRNFADMIEDQFDFHSYCLRKVTLRAYVTLLRFEDRIRIHPYYVRAVNGFVQCLLQLYNLSDTERSMLVGEHEELKGYDSMNEAQRRKAISKRRKRLARQRQIQHASHTVRGNSKLHGIDPEGSKSRLNDDGKTKCETSGDNKTKSSLGWMEIDSTGTEQIKELFRNDGSGNMVLLKAAHVVAELEHHLPGDIRTHILSFEIALRRHKYLLVLRAARRALELDPEHPSTLFLQVRLGHEIENGSILNSFSRIVAKVYEAKGDLLDGATPIQFLNSFIRRNTDNCFRLLGACRAQLWLTFTQPCCSLTADDTLHLALDIISRIQTEGNGENVISARSCKQFVDDLKNDGVPNNVLSKIRDCFRKKFTYSTCFDSV